MTPFTPPNPNYAARVRATFTQQPMSQFMQAELVDLGPGWVEITMPGRPELLQQHGQLHGGAVAFLVDVAGGFATYTMIPEDASAVTVEYKLNLLRPGIGDRFSTRCEVIKPGRTLMIVQADVFAHDTTQPDATPILCATSLQTIMVLHGKPDNTTV